MEEIYIQELIRMDLKDATIIDGFPSVGLVSSIAANYLINALDLKQIAVMDSVYFPTVSLIRDSTPNNPVRIYANQKVQGEEDTKQVVVFISEFQPPPNLIKPIASAILDWAEEQKCSLILSPEGLVIDRESIEKEEDNSDVAVYGVGSTDRVRDMMIEGGALDFQEGVITGVAGVLLNEGKMRDFDVVTLLAEAHPDYPDARAAAKAVEIIDSMVLHSYLDAKPLYEEAERIESQLVEIHKQAASETPGKKPGGRPSMYG